MPKRRLSTIQLGAVHLNVSDLELMKNFYTHVLGLETLSETETEVALGHDQKILVLHHRTDITHAATGHAGLYHFAVLFASRADLSRTLQRVLTHTPHFFTGSADHLVSEAFYLNDPEGNGIELYFDREPSTWKWENEQIQMASIYLDPVAYITHNLADTAEESVSLGHMHFKVGDIQQAEKFYVDVLGFDITAKLPGALFISVAGYHHHIGLNTWESEGAGKRGESLGLRHFEIGLQRETEFRSLLKRLDDNHIPYTDNDSSAVLHDPWGNEVRVHVL